MSNFNTESLKNSMLSQVSALTGLNNSSPSSVLSSIVEGTARASLAALTSSNKRLDSMYTENAEGVDLDLNAREWGVFRNEFNESFLFSEEKSVVITTDNGDVFPSRFLGRALIISGQKYDIGEHTEIEFLNDVILTEGAKEEAVTIRIVYGGNNNSLNKNAIVDLGRDGNTHLKGLVIKFKENILVSRTKESDDDFRSRVNFAKTVRHGASLGMIEYLVKSIPDLYGYRINNNVEMNSVDIYIASIAYMKNKGDYSLLPTVNALSERIRNYGIIGKKYNVYTPDIYSLGIRYDYAGTVRTASINAISYAWSNVYSYTLTSSISPKLLQDELDSIGVAVIIKDMYLEHPLYGVIYTTDGPTIQIPANVIISIDQDKLEGKEIQL